MRTSGHDEQREVKDGSGDGEAESDSEGRGAVQDKPKLRTVKTIDIDQKKIGYLMYNQFLGNVESENKDYNLELNNVFGEFKSQSVDELVLDLRYNPGGRISTSINLA